jgi:ornithine carbamoyltransferase
MLADILTMRDHTRKPLAEVSYCYPGDGRNNTASSLLVTGAILGMDVRICARSRCSQGLRCADHRAGLAAGSGARLAVTADVAEAVAGADYLHTDVWLSMGSRPRSETRASVRCCRTRSTRTGNPAVRFMHYLPALHNGDARMGRRSTTGAA